MASTLASRLLGWGAMSAAVGLGLIVASFVGEDTPELGLWGLALLLFGAGLATTYYLMRRGQR